MALIQVLLAAVARKLTDKNLKTFTIGFNESKYDEAGHAKAISDYLQTDHHEFVVTENDALELVDDIISSDDEPYTDSSALPTMLVSKLARKHVTMVLSGDGGDELFHGYGAYNWAKRLSNPMLRMFRKPIASSLSLQDERKKRAAHLFQYKNYDRIKSHIFSQEQYLFSDNEIDEMLTDGYKASISLEEDYDDLNRKFSPAEGQACLILSII